MAWRYLTLFILLVALTVIIEIESRFQNDTPAKRRHARHFHSRLNHRKSANFEKDLKISQDKNSEDSSRYQSYNAYDKSIKDPQEMFYKEEEEEEEEEHVRQKYVQDINAWLKLLPPDCSVNPQCNVDMELSKAIRILQIKEQILRETGLAAPPNMTGVVISINPVLQALISRLNRQGDDSKNKNDGFLSGAFGDDPNIRKKKVFVPATRGPESVKIPMGKLHFFNLSSEHPSSIEQAILHIYLKPISGFVPKDKVAQISFFKVEPPKFQHDYNRLRSVPSVNNVITVPYSSSGSWEKVDIFSLVREWLSNHVMNLGFVINITVDGINLEIDTAEEDPAHAPMLEMDVKEEKNDRQKRYIGNRICSEEKRERECCRYPLIVDFTEYEYDFIVAPKKYVANYCRGECPFLYAHKLPHSTVLQQMFPNTSTYHHGPCCGASDLAPLKMVYYDGSKIKIETIEDMVVIQCSCK